MNAAQPQSTLSTRLAALALSGVIGVAVVGFFLGVNDGVPVVDRRDVVDDLATPPRAITEGPEVVPATAYDKMRRGETGPTALHSPSLKRIPQPEFDLFEEFKPSEDAKRLSIAVRAQRRAFNGAPPVIPHAVERTSDGACYACHGSGKRIGENVANPMSHGFLANCLQCHAPPPPSPFADIELQTDNEFAGLATPQQGERAYPGAPPTIPHSTWMRERCLSCHGRSAGWAGLESTHPWRTNCQQCHAPSAELEQAVAAESGFLPPRETTQP